MRASPQCCNLNGLHVLLCDITLISGVVASVVIVVCLLVGWLFFNQ